MVPASEPPPSWRVVTASINRPADRYGDRSPGLGLKLAGAAIAVALVVAALLFIARASDAQIEAKALSWDKTSDGVMTAVVEVLRRPGSEVACDVVVLDIRQVMVGQLELIVPPSSERRTVTTVDVPLQGDGVAVSVRGCEPTEGR
jgi:hypothetical protein